MATANQEHVLINLSSTDTENLTQQVFQESAKVGVEQYLTNLKIELQEIGDYLLSLSSIDISHPAQQDVQDLAKVQVEQYYIKKELSGEYELYINLKHLPVKKLWLMDKSDEDNNVTVGSNAPGYDSDGECTCTDTSDDEDYYSYMLPDSSEKETDIKPVITADANNNCDSNLPKSDSPNLEYPEEVHDPLHSMIEQTKSLVIHVKRHSFNTKPTSRYPKRTTPRVSYVEQEAPDDDELIFCQDCNLWHLGDCPIHGALIIVKDMEVAADGRDPCRAENTLPPCLTIKKSLVPEAGMGVFSTGVIPKGTRFGPYEGVHVDVKDHTADLRFLLSFPIREKLWYCWEIYKDGEPSHYIDAFDQSLSNWMRFVNCPSHKDQQNLMAFQYKGGIYYCTMVEIPQNTELLVWCGDQHNIQQKNPTTRSSKTKFMAAAQRKTVEPSQPKMINRKRKYRKRKKQCSVSGKGFNKSNDPNKHQRIRTVKKAYMCSVCGEEFSQSRKLKIHKRLHSREKPYTCSICEKLFITSNDLQMHQRMHTGDSSYTCCVSLCRRQTGDCNRHQTIHTGGKSYKSGASGKHGKGFNRSSCLQVHQPNNPTTQASQPKPKEPSKPKLTEPSQLKIDNHQRKQLPRKKSHTCSVCGKVFTRSDVFHIHQRTHTGEKPCTCSVCGKRYNQSGNLHRHQRIHTGVKPYTFGVCGKRFAWQTIFQVHQGTHTAEKPYKCSVCDKGFKTSSNLHRHKKTHTGEKPYTCSECGEGFTDSIHLHRHKTIHEIKKHL